MCGLSVARDSALVRFARTRSDVLVLTRFTQMGSNFCVSVLARKFLCFGFGAQIFVFQFWRAFQISTNASKFTGLF